MIIMISVGPNQGNGNMTTAFNGRDGSPPANTRFSVQTNGGNGSRARDKVKTEIVLQTFNDDAAADTGITNL